MPDLTLARKVLQTEAAAVLALVNRLDERFAHAAALICQCKGRVIVTGMGKSGIICRKIAATLASTGTPAFFLHPAEAIHGDLGVLQSDDVIVALSHSGETEELLRLLESIRRIGAQLIAITGDPLSTLAKAADVTSRIDGAAPSGQHDYRLQRKSAAAETSLKRQGEAKTRIANSEWRGRSSCTPESAASDHESRSGTPRAMADAASLRPRG